jgi:hypothetical protein
MRTTLTLIALLGSALTSTALFACSSEVKASDFAQRDSGVTQSGDGGVKTGAPIKSPTTSKDAGTTTPKPPPANAPETCKAAVECLADCESDEACDACYGGMSDPELKELQNISLCIADSGCTTDECVGEVCADVINTCLAE